MKTSSRILILSFLTLTQIGSTFAAKEPSIIPPSPEMDPIAISDSGLIVPALGSTEFMECYYFVDHNSGRNKLEIRIKFEVIPFYEDKSEDMIMDEPTQSHRNMPQNIPMNTLAEYFYETVGVWDANDPRLEEEFEFFEIPGDDGPIQLCHYRQQQ